MLAWCALLFGLGIAAFTDSIFNYGEIFRQVNSVLFMLISLGLLIRTTTKIRQAKREKIYERMAALERELEQYKAHEERKNKMQRGRSQAAV
ncbi:MAG: hypothetical protein GF341_07535 [candidate division Zixibacteria bacterium]|nr:hypothetical protein [candidate division Zixibacteria bacterium]